MEQQIKELVTLMQEKTRLFEKYESMTDDLVEASDIVAMEDYITKRGDLANKIDIVDDKIKKLLLQVFGEDGKQALAPNTSRESLSEELRGIYDANLPIMETVRRIRLKNSDITAECQRMRDELEQKIRESSNQPKINRYLNNLSSANDVNNLGSV